MNYRFVDKSKVASAIRRDDALQAELVAVEAEIIAAAVNGEGKEAADQAARERRALADSKREREGILDSDVAAAVRDYLGNWCSAMEERHLALSTQIELREENDEAAQPDAQVEAVHLGACLQAAYDVLDGLPAATPLKGDGGTRSRQARRAKPRPARPKKAAAKRR